MQKFHKFVIYFTLGLVVLVLAAAVLTPSGKLERRQSEIGGEMVALDSLISQGNRISDGFHDLGPYLTLEQYQTVRLIGLRSIPDMEAILRALDGIDSNYAGMSGAEYRSHMRRVADMRLAVSRSFDRADSILKVAVMKRATLTGHSRGT
ncbi:hypothetical protein M1432_00865 [Patescibacteria group bacterium]|nr:hypothetical protein [Patescibacteria group bacterium]